MSEQIPRLNDHERMLSFNDTLKPYSKDKTIVDLFEVQVAETPDHIALQLGEQTMSYAELNERANRLARYLVNNGVQNADNIGLIVNRGFEMIIGMYAILKAGGAYVPIDPEYPLDRQEYILKQSSVKLVIADADYPLKDTIGQELYIVMNAIDVSGYKSDNVGIKTDSTQLAYTIYTSGSTGRPKGVMIEHHSAVNLIEWVNTTFQVGTNDRLLFITSMCFDLSVYDLFGILAAGGTVIIARMHEIRDVKKLQEFLQRYAITFWDSVPTTLDYLVKDVEQSKTKYIQKDLRLVFMSGDWIPVDLPNRIKNFFPNVRVISLGGATEGTIWSNYYPVLKTEPGWKSIPYGRPLQNNFFYILDDELQPIPIGTVGELYIGGVGVARGYANDKEKTAYSFVKDPFNSEAGGRMYRTGDLGRMLPDMNMEFIGRKDNQVKIRGFRVELGEIESVLRQIESVREAVILARPDQEGTRTLVGYIVPNGSFNRDTIMHYLSSKLPEYMVPAAWVMLDQLPLTSNGKIDRKALPDYDATEQVKDQYAPPRNELDTLLVTIWQEAIGLEKVGIDDNFFELGGHSLMAVQIITKFENKKGKNLPLAILFQYPTIRELVDFIKEGEADKKTIWKSLVPIKATGTKMPIYIIHGDGLNVLNFSHLANYVDEEQPVFGLQAHGLDGIEEPLNDMTEIASHYLKEILEHNPEGPYAIAGYSFGGYVGIEMKRQLELMGKKVKMLAMLDTNAQNTEINKKWIVKLPKKIKRQVPKFFWIMKLLWSHPRRTIKYQWRYVVQPFKRLGRSKASEEIYNRFRKINENHQQAFRYYKLEPFNDKIYLFRAKVRIYFVDDRTWLGWKKYAKQGVIVYDVPGDHKTMFQEPQVKELARNLQHALDNC